MFTVSPLSSQPNFGPGPMIMIPWAPPNPLIDFTQAIGPQLPAAGTPVVRPSDGCQWTVQSAFPWPDWPDRICLVLTLVTQVTPPATPPANIKTSDVLNVGN